MGSSGMSPMMMGLALGTTGAALVSGMDAITGGKGSLNAGPDVKDRLNKAIKKANPNEAQEKMEAEQKRNLATGTREAAVRAMQNAGRADVGFGGTILTGPMGAPPAPTQQKTLLGS